MTEPWLARVERRLRAEVPASPDFNARVLGRIRRPRRRLPQGLWLGAGLAAAAALAWTVTASRARVEFSIEAPGASAVALVGDFNDWDSRRTPLQQGPGGRWRADLPLPGGLYHYAFLVDGRRWVADPARPGHPDPDFGRVLSLVAVE